VDEDLKGDFGCEYSKDGSKMAVVTRTNVNVYDSTSEDLLFTIDRKKVSSTCFSPLGTFFVTYERTPAETGNNLNIWRVADGTFILLYVHVTPTEE
jgi:uncharacterized protein with WD repeat